jgi:hypothetical protein
MSTRPSASPPPSPASAAPPVALASPAPRRPPTRAHLSANLPFDVSCYDLYVVAGDIERERPVTGESGGAFGTCEEADRSAGLAQPRSRTRTVCRATTCGPAVGCCRPLSRSHQPLQPDRTLRGSRRRTARRSSRTCRRCTGPAPRRRSPRPSCSWPQMTERDDRAGPGSRRRPDGLTPRASRPPRPTELGQPTVPGRPRRADRAGPTAPGRPRRANRPSWASRPRQADRAGVSRPGSRGRPSTGPGAAA